MSLKTRLAGELGTLRAKLLLGVLVPVGLLVTAALLQLPRELQRQAEAGFREHGSSMAAMAAEWVRPAWTEGSAAGAADRLAEFAGMIQGAVALEFMVGDSVLSRWEGASGSFGSGTPVAFTHPVRSPGSAGVAATVRLYLDPDWSAVGTDPEPAPFPVVVLLAVVVALGGAWYMAVSLSRSMASIAEVAREITGGRRDRRAPRTGLAEADELVESFNAMVDQVSASEEDLREANLFLEARVAARTRELEAEVAERRRAEQASSLLATAVEQSTEIHTIYDERGLVLYANPAFETISGFTLADLQGRSGREIWNTPEAETAWWDMWHTVRSGESWRSRLTLQRKDGGAYELMVTVSPVRGMRGEPTRYVSVAYDVTKERELEEQLRHAQKMEAVGRLAGGVAHDFNNLLTAILGYAESLQFDLADNDPASDDVAEIQRAAERAASLTSQLLAFSRRQSLELEEVEIGAAIREVQGMVGRLIGSHIQLDLNLPAEELWVRADRGQLTQIFLNLAVNARDAMPEGGDLSFAARLEPGEGGEAPGVVVEITDTGIGIPREHLNRIFEPFFTTKEPGSGTGLGLSTVFGIMEQLGGHIAADSAPGQGTTFTLRMPAIAHPGQEVQEHLQSEVSSRGEDPGGRTVLLVDDEEAVRKLVRRMLEDDGYVVREAPNGVEALGSVQGSDEFDVVITDVIMPGMTGVVLAQEIGAVRPDLRVILMSGYTAEALSESGAENGRYPLVPKPFRRADLRRALAATGVVTDVESQG